MSSPFFADPPVFVSGAIDLRLHLVFFALGILGRLLDALFRGLGIGQLHRVEIGCERRLGLRIGGV